MLWSALAPAIHHNVASSLISLKMAVILGEKPQKIQQFPIPMFTNPPCHQNNQGVEALAR